MSEAAPIDVCVVGGGTAGWMAASMMAKFWADQPVRLSVVESPDIGIVGVGEGSTPSLKGFFDYLDIDEAEWMPACQATYKLGIRFVGWSRRPGFGSYFHPFPSDLDDRSAPAFYYHAFARRNGVDLPAHPDRFFLNTLLADQRRGPHADHNFPFRLAYGYHFDAQLIGRFLRGWATRRGVEHIEATVAEVERGEDGDIQALRCSDGRRIEADFFVDSTGFRSLLLQRALGVRFLSFADNLFNDRAVVAQTPLDDPTAPPCETRATALSAGWCWRIPLTARSGNGYVYSSRFIEPEAAEREFRDHLGLDADAGVRHLEMKVGRVESAWSNNCLAVGLSQGFVEPLEATALHVVQETVQRFLEAFEEGGRTARLRERFNHQINRRVEGIRDYIVCHYRASQRDDSEYWRACAGIEALSPSLRELLGVWFAGGDLAEEIKRQQIGAYYAPLSWHCLLGGYGVYPDPARLRSPEARMQRFDLARIDDFLARCALNFRAHAEQLAHG
ncbi:tryptophan halogenase family protein [Pseudomarimonas salicorniae]|uniref:Tryptophan 7-halogenase n=1 Tax=Pseudomarimonas salicorniae TaxID=2933270 RepID=A0ABT0GIS7_9GAMM|nr:tryptophan 7-halogenase [Lysobacter sp. CAU 1642]